jgi:hypothetical protein
MTRSSGGVLLIPKYGSNQFVVVNSTDKPKPKPNLSFEQKVSIPNPTQKQPSKRVVSDSQRATTKKKSSSISLPPIDDDEADLEEDEVVVKTSLFSSKTTTSADLSSQPPSSSKIESSDIDASSHSEESELENTNNIHISRVPTSKRAKLTKENPVQAKEKAEKAPNPPQKEKPFLPKDKLKEQPIQAKENASFQSSKVQAQKKKLPETIAFSDSSNIVQQTENFISSSLLKRKEAEKAIYQAQRKFTEYKDASDLRRKEQETQLHSYSKDIFAKTRVLSMFQQITNLSLHAESQFKYKWVQKGKTGEFVAMLEYFPEDSVYHIQPKVVPEAIDRMDEAYQSFKSEMYISSQQLSLLYERIQNVLSCE